MPYSRRDVVKGIGVVTAGALAFHGGRSWLATPARAQQAGTIRVGWMKLGCISPYFVATANGSWEKRGLKVEHYEFKGGPPMLEAFASDRLDAGFIGGPPVIAAVSRGLPLKFVAGNHLSGMGLVARPGIASLKDLKGKKIGNAPAGAISDIELRATLRDAGMDWSKDVQIVTMGYGDMATAMVSGAVDAIASCESYPSYVLEKIPGSKQVASQIDGTFWPGRDGQCCGLVVRMPYADREKAAMRALVEGQLEAIAFINASRSKAAALIAKALGTTASAEEAGLSHEVVQAEMTVKSVQQHADMMVELGVLKKAPAMASHIDNDFWKSVQRG